MKYNIFSYQVTMQKGNWEKICELGPELMEKQIVQGERFFYENFDIKYVNSSKAYFRNQPRVDNVNVENYLCFQEGDMLRKVTEIAYKDKRILIEDTFEVRERQMTQESDAPKKKDRITLFPTQKGKKGQEMIRIQKKDKKNVVKNIVKLFITWLQKKKKQIISPYKESKSQLKRLMTTYNYNNKLICEMLENNIISKVFYQFLTSDADEGIGKSKIVDKQTHHQAIEHYVQFFSQAAKISQSEKNQENEVEAGSSEAKRSSEKNAANPSSTNEANGKSD